MYKKHGDLSTLWWQNMSQCFGDRVIELAGTVNVNVNDAIVKICRINQPHPTPTPTYHLLPTTYHLPPTPNTPIPLPPSSIPPPHPPPLPTAINVHFGVDKYIHPYFAVECNSDILQSRAALARRRWREKYRPIWVLLVSAVQAPTRSIASIFILILVLNIDIGIMYLYFLFKPHNGQCVAFIEINTLWPNDAIRRQRTDSTLAKALACCLTAPSH